jgi:hypothetical protein
MPRCRSLPCDANTQSAGYDSLAGSRALPSGATSGSTPRGRIRRPALALADATARYLNPDARARPNPAGAVRWPHRSGQQPPSPARKTCRSLCANRPRRAGSRPQPAAILPILKGSGRRPDRHDPPGHQDHGVLVMPRTLRDQGEQQEPVEGRRHALNPLRHRIVGLPRRIPFVRATRRCAGASTGPGVRPAKTEETCGSDSADGRPADAVRTGRSCRPTQVPTIVRLGRFSASGI